MSNPGEIPFVLKGPRGNAELSDFVNAVNALRNTITNACRCIAATEDIAYDVSELRLGSACVAVSPVMNGIPREVLEDVSMAVNSSFAAIEQGEDPDYRFDYLTLRAMNGFASIARKPDADLRVFDVKLTHAFVARITKLLEPNLSTLGSVTGRLEQFSIHKTNRFTLYPPVSGEDVDCVFDRKDLPAVLLAVDHSVVVYGTLHYAKNKTFPVKVDVEHFEVLPDPKSLPTLLNRCGALSLDSPSQEVIRKSRNEWQ